MTMETLKHEPSLDPPKQRAVCTCSECGEPIYEGESAYNLPQWGWVCEDCMKAAYKVVEW